MRGGQRPDGTQAQPKPEFLRFIPYKTYLEWNFKGLSLSVNGGCVLHRSLRRLSATSRGIRQERITMTIDFEKLLDKQRQSDLADEIVTATAAVVSNASSPDFAVRSLEQGILAELSPEQSDAAIALQAYGVGCAGEVLSAGLDPSAAERADALRSALAEKCPDGALARLSRQPDAAATFKSRMCQAIAGKCAELAAADIDRLKKGKITILNEEDREIFDRQHEERGQKQAQAATHFLSSLPERYPSFGSALFNDIRQAVQRDMEEKYKSPDIHTRIETMFKDALKVMPADIRAQAK